MRRVISFIALLLPFAGPAGCASQASIQSAPLHAGISRTFLADFDATRQAARESVEESGLRIEQSEQVSDESWMIIGHMPESDFSWGEYVRVLVARVDGEQTTVRVFAKKRRGFPKSGRVDDPKSILSTIELKLSGGLQ